MTYFKVLYQYLSIGIEVIHKMLGFQVEKWRRVHLHKNIALKIAEFV
jgi:hypothetical protein